ncbi:ATP-binding protein [Gilvimarinus xylanilyticus]|uniref:ATP-binding protein n=1 Tax=Gilvimarinus xylanilyticus TaxID=2944139 RepID=A0A9X2I4V9_9GAMM|nr:ATP-binding protein [Gilvimarinus xylanilyticus]MCP8900051.1 ATP-binding protein [Gilvimarinus xylanilyticus]
MSGMINSKKFDIAIKHRNWQVALAETFSVLSCASPGEVVSIVGPSRAGKSLLIRKVAEMMFGKCRFVDTGLMDAVVVEAVNAGPHGSFSTKAFTQRMLEAVKHPLFTIKGQDLDDVIAMQKMDRATEATLRIALENAIRERRVQFLFIDEAQHIRYASKDAQAAHAYMDSLKCLAQTTGIVLVLVGAYPILDMLKNSPHLLGRNHQVHFPRYHANAEDIYYFAQILNTYSGMLSLAPCVGDLKHVAEDLYEGSFGCIGLLKAWLKRVDSVASYQGTPITRELLMSKRLSDVDLAEIGAEIQLGEKSLRRSSLSRQGQKDTTGASRAEKKKTKAKPFQKKPVRRKPGNRTEVPEHE